jgi:hypothetical protein
LHKSTQSRAKLQRTSARGAQLCSNCCGSLASVAPSANGRTRIKSAWRQRSQIQRCFHPAMYTNLLPLPRCYSRSQRVTRVPTHTAAWLLANGPADRLFLFLRDLEKQPLLRLSDNGGKAAKHMMTMLLGYADRSEAGSIACALVLQAEAFSCRKRRAFIPIGLLYGGRNPASA